MSRTPCGFEKEWLGNQYRSYPVCFPSHLFFSVLSVGDLPSGGFRVEGPCLPPYSGIRRAGVKFMRVWARMFFKKILYLTHPERVE